MTLPLTSPFTSGVKVTKLQLDQLVASINALNGLASHYKFWGNFNTSKTVTAGANAAYDVIQDPSSGWNSTTKAWSAPVAGTYQVNLQFKWNATAPTQATAYAQIIKNGSVSLQSPNTSSPGGFGGIVFAGPVACAAGDTISVQTGATFTTQNDSPAGNNFLFINWVGA